MTAAARAARGTDHEYAQTEENVFVARKFVCPIASPGLL